MPHEGLEAGDLQNDTERENRGRDKEQLDTLIIQMRLGRRSGSEGVEVAFDV